VRAGASSPARAPLPPPATRLPAAHAGDSPAERKAQVYKAMRSATMAKPARIRGFSKGGLGGGAGAMAGIWLLMACSTSTTTTIMAIRRMMAIPACASCMYSLPTLPTTLGSIRPIFCFARKDGVGMHSCAFRGGIHSCAYPALWGRGKRALSGRATRSTAIDNYKNKININCCAWCARGGAGQPTRAQPPPPHRAAPLFGAWGLAAERMVRTAVRITTLQQGASSSYCSPHCDASDEGGASGPCRRRTQGCRLPTTG